MRQMVRAEGIFLTLNCEVHGKSKPSSDFSLSMCLAPTLARCGFFFHPNENTRNVYFNLNVTLSSGDCAQKIVSQFRDLVLFYDVHSR